MVTWRNLHFPDCAPTIDGFPGRYIQGPDSVSIMGIGDNVHIVPGPGANVAVFTQAFPVFAAIVRAEDGPVLSIDDSPHALGLGGRDDHTDFTQHSFG